MNPFISFSLEQLEDAHEYFTLIDDRIGVALVEEAFDEATTIDIEKI